MKLGNVEDVYALSPIQEGMLFHTLAEPGSGVYVDQIHTTLGHLDRSVFQRAWSAVVERHAALRTAFVWDGVDEPLQVVRESVDLPWRVEDWRGVAAAEQADRFGRLLAADRQAGFDLAVAPLMRMALVRVAETDWRWLWSFQHLILDGWSARLLLTEVGKLYHAARRGERVDLAEPFAYREYIAWLARQDPGPAETFWRRELAGFDEATPLGWLDLDRSAAPEGRAERHVDQLSLRLEREASERLRALTTEQRVTLSTVLQGAWALLLGRCCRRDEVVFGVTTAGRPPELAGIEKGVGLFINTLPLRVELDAERPVGDWLRKVQRRQIEARRWEHCPLVEVHAWSDLPPGEGLFDSLLVFENLAEAVDRSSDGALEVGALEFVEQSNYPLALLVVPGERLELRAVFDRDRFGRPAIERLLRLLSNLLAAFTAAPAAKLGEIALADADERRRTLADWGRVDAAGPRPTLVPELFGRMVAARPDAPAVVAAGPDSADRELSYRQLADRSAAIAQRLRAAGVGSGSVVGLFVERSPEMIAGMLGILEAGAAYLPLDPAYPEAQTRFVVDEAGASLILAQGGLRSRLPAMEAPCLTLEDGAAEGPAPPEATPRAPDDLAYLIYTSGSSGRPNGVEVTHANLAHSTAARSAVYPGAVGRFLLLSSFAFDSSVAGIFWTLATGGTLVLPPVGLERDAEGFGRLVARQRVTHTLCLPTLYGVLLEAVAAGDLESLEVVIVAGEVCSPTMARRHAATLPGTRLYNEYGPTEGTVWSTVHQLAPDEPGHRVPIGRPIPGSRLVVLDAAGQPVPPGVVGELYVAGEGVARGYRARPELTAERFVELRLPELAGEPSNGRRAYRTGDLVAWRADGLLDFLGRVDSQVKLRGYRIETGGIEALLRGHPSVDEAAVVVHQASTAPPRDLLAAFVAPSPGAAVGAEEVRRHLEARLPAFSVPDRILVVERLPRLPNGKIDYRGLPEAGVADGETFVEPRGEVEETLAEIWAELLGVERVGAQDSFFRLGGDSILMIQAVSRVRQAGLAVRPGDLFDKPTLAEWAEVVDRQPALAVSAEPLGGEVPLSPIQLWFLERRLAAPQHWNLSRLFEVPADFDGALFGRALGACLAHHDLLRARFEREANGWRQQVAAPDELSVPFTTCRVDGDDEGAKALAELEAGFDLEAGPLVAARWLDRGRDRPGRLLIAVHHLVIDVVSWSILGEDLATNYGRLRAGEPIALPARTASYRQWVETLHEQAAGPAVAAELDHWLDAVGRTGLPVDFETASRATEADAERVTTVLDRETTEALTSSALAAYNSRTDELMLAALLFAWRRWSGRRTLRLGLEGHGRGLEALDLSRTVGWFTCAYPVALRLAGEDGEELALLVPAVKEQLRAVPGDGSGYGILRYLRREPALVARPEPELLFNYLGRRWTEGDAPWRPLAGTGRGSRAAVNARSHELEVNAAIRDGQLVVEWTYCRTIHRRRTIESFADAFRGALVEVVAHCVSDGAGAVTGSDFPDAGLDGEELERLLGRLEPGGGRAS